MKQWTLLQYAVGVIIIMTLLVLQYREKLHDAELKTIDWRASILFDSQLSQKNLNTCMVSISDETLRSVGGWPHPREYTSLVLEYISEAKPRDMMVDLLFLPEEKRSDEDQKSFLQGLRRAASKAPIILASLFEVQQILDPQTWETRSTLTLREADTEVTSGTVNIGDLAGMNKDTAIRRMPLLIMHGDDIEPSLAFGGFLASLGISGNPAAYIECDEKNSIVKILLPSNINPETPATETSAIPSGLKKWTVVRSGKTYLEIPVKFTSFSGGAAASGESRMAVVRLVQRRFGVGAREMEFSDLLAAAMNHRAITLIGNGDINAASKLLEMSMAIAEKRSNSHLTDMVGLNLKKLRQGETDQLTDIEPNSWFTGRHVIIMPTATGLFDFYPSPLDMKKIPGGWVHVALLEQLNDGMAPATLEERSGGNWPLAFTALTTFICLTLVIRGKSAVSKLLMALAATAVILTIIMTGYMNGLILPMVYPMLGCLGIYIASTTLSIAFEQRHGRNLLKVFSRYVSPEVAEEILRNSDRVSLTGAHYDASVMFLDVCGFTTFSEENEPETVFASLNELFGKIVPHIFDNRGILDKYIGDAIMAVFGVPVRDQNHRGQVLKAAVNILETVRIHNQSLEPGKPRLQISMGIASGSLVAGNIGTSSRMEYTVIGDIVNLAARLEAFAGAGECVVSEKTARDQGDICTLQELPPFTVKGKKAPIKAYRIMEKELS
ncbi:MAG: hypothetical protein CVV64_02190 [Candidatus Wallbacteria bacterium HGW-Wallbacteria-1]|jgi:class 3 adenylate cyclase|uniref:Guanylate cyclase domain-containing protein n=1 Tax=Candidatus Wallbacteria bacterium HGW-Wallbacteria-1 TaxID=2013854 RepID=A0A2N1PV76_9BACT|nr:MAG: hypothetical protein CVV64_02190 [Candidatus Wallbacteria bacterium HGW-Wallbacteria-1]